MSKVYFKDDDDLVEVLKTYPIVFDILCDKSIMSFDKDRVNGLLGFKLIGYRDEIDGEITPEVTNENLDRVMRELDKKGLLEKK